MYQFDFLEAKVPLTKVFQRTDTGYEVVPYPMVKNFTSQRREAKDLAELYQILQQHAGLGHCLLKGLLNTQLVQEPRAGHTDPAATTPWLLLDLDFADGWNSVSEFLDELAPEFKDVSYIFQHSSSAGIKGVPGLRGHIWVLLNEPVSPQVLKEWLRARNLETPKLADRLTLTANGQSLRWPLDITTCQNDKLLYIAPPVCEGFDDPLEKKRFELVVREKERAAPPALKTSPAVLNAKQKEKIEALRKQANLPEVKPKYKKVGDTEVLVNPDEAVITGVKRARGFVYLNLNGGDSWGYYFHEAKPDLVYNFKGEPPVYLRDIAPSFYEQFAAQVRAEHAQVEQETRWAERRPFVFRDWARDTYYNALYFPKEDRVDLAKTNSLVRLQHFCMQYNEAPPEVIEDWTVEFNPTTLKIIDFDKRWINTFNPSPFLRTDWTDKRPSALPPTIDKIVSSVCSRDAEAKTHFLNWLAYIFQTRKKTATAWIFHGVQGTGKGILVSRILKPLLGTEHVVEVTLSDLEDRFNANFERALILWIDEFQVGNAREADKIMNRLKNLVTEERISLRGMHKEAVPTLNYTNIIIATNHPDPVQLSVHDRRFNVPPAQEQKLAITYAELMQIEKELPDFASYLQFYQVDNAAVRQILMNEARENMIIASQTTVEHFFHAIRTGDLDYFLGFQDARAKLSSDPVFATEYERLMTDWCRAAVAKEHLIVPYADLQRMYTYIIGSAMSPAKFGRVCAIHRLTESRTTVGNQVIRGHWVEWHGPEEDVKRFLAARQENKPTLVPKQGAAA